MKEKLQLSIKTILDNSDLIGAPSYIHFEDCKVAREFAKHNHGKQMYGEVPYTSHLDDVAMMFNALVFDICKPSTDTLISCILHDVVEDTDVTIEKVEATFGADVATMVYFVTKSDGLSRPEALKELVERIENADMMNEIDVYSILLKMADRICNMTRSASGNTEKDQSRYSRYLMEGVVLNAAITKKTTQNFNSETQRFAMKRALFILNDVV